MKNETTGQQIEEMIYRNYSLWFQKGGGFEDLRKPIADAIDKAIYEAIDQVIPKWVIWNGQEESVPHFTYVFISFTNSSEVRVGIWDEDGKGFRDCMGGWMMKNVRGYRHFPVRFFDWR